MNNNKAWETAQAMMYADAEGVEQSAGQKALERLELLSKLIIPDRTKTDAENLENYMRAVEIITNYEQQLLKEV